MAAHRYWRIQVIASGNFSSIGEIQLRDSIGGANRIGSGTASANSTYSGAYLATAAIDGNTATDWCSAGADTTPNWWQYDFGSGNAFDIVQVVITAATSGDANYTPSDFTLAFSDNGTTWTALYRFHRSAAWTSGASQTFTFISGSGSTHSSWRINVTSTALNSYVEIAELALRATPGGGNLLSSGSPNAYASSVFPGGGNDPNKVYDGSNTTSWSTGNATTPPQWWAVDLGTTSDVQEIAITAHASDNVGYLPLTFDLQYSDDGGITWATRRSFTTGAWSLAQTKTFAVVSNTTWSTTDKSASMTLSGGNLIATAGAALQSVRAVHPKRTGKYYIEYNVGTVSNGTQIGFGTAATPFGASGALTQSFTVQGNGSANTAFDSFGVQITGLGFQSVTVLNVLLCAAIDLDNALIWFRVGAAAVWNNNAANNPATGVGGISLSRTGLGTPGMDVYPFLVLGASTNTTTANFGGSAFTGAVPAGFTSGWDDSVAVVTNEVVTQTGVEEWGSSVPAMQATQVGVEEWGTPANPAAVTQVSAEHWAAASPDAAITQALVEHWGTVSTISTPTVVTQVAVEHWITEAAVSTARKRRVVCVSG